MMIEKILYSGYIQPLSIRVVSVLGVVSSTLISLVLSIVALSQKVICIAFVMATIQIAIAWCLSVYFRRYYITENGIYLSDARFVFKIRKYIWEDIKYIQRKYLWYDNYGKENAKEKELCILVFTNISKNQEEFEELKYFNDIKWGYMSCQKTYFMLV